MMIVMMFGPPQSGKGTFGRRISRSLGIDYVSAGDAIRERLEEDESWFRGRYSMRMHDGGEFCPPDLVRNLVFDLIRDAGMRCVLDGYPRNRQQFETLSDLGGEYIVVHLVVPDEELVRRASDRRICGGCGEVYNLGNPHMMPTDDGRCTICGDAVIRRGDDQEEIVRARLAKYRAETEIILSDVEALSTRVIRFESDDGGDDVDAKASKIVDMLRAMLDGSRQSG